LLSPALILMVVAISAPLLTTPSMSLWSMSGHSVDKTLSLGNYVVMTEHPMTGVLIGRTLTVALLATAVTVALCYPIAYFVAFHVHSHKALWLIIIFVFLSLRLGRVGLSLHPKTTGRA
jgi:spermidine/putrescine transport system permease protein